jgi:hypothetical protein
MFKEEKVFVSTHILNNHYMFEKEIKLARGRQSLLENLLIKKKHWTGKHLQKS